MASPLDYGPFRLHGRLRSWFHLLTTPTTTAAMPLINSAYIGLWNLSCLAQALLPLAEKEDLKRRSSTATRLACEGRYMELMRAKFGLIETKEEDAR